MKRVTGPRVTRSRGHPGSRRTSLPPLGNPGPYATTEPLASNPFRGCSGGDPGSRPLPRNQWVGSEWEEPPRGHLSFTRRSRAQAKHVPLGILWRQRASPARQCPTREMGQFHGEKDEVPLARTENLGHGFGLRPKPQEASALLATPSPGARTFSWHSQNGSLPPHPPERRHNPYSQRRTHVEYPGKPSAHHPLCARSLTRHRAWKNVARGLGATGRDDPSRCGGCTRTTTCWAIRPAFTEVTDEGYGANGPHGTGRDASDRHRQPGHTEHSRPKPPRRRLPPLGTTVRPCRGSGLRRFGRFATPGPGVTGSTGPPARVLKEPPRTSSPGHPSSGGRPTLQPKGPKDLGHSRQISSLALNCCLLIFVNVPGEGESWTRRGLGKSALRVREFNQPPIMQIQVVDGERSFCIWRRKSSKSTDINGKQFDVQ